MATDDEHDREGHTIAFERQQVAGLLRRARLDLVEVEAAMARVERGTYGPCEGCGESLHHHSTSCSERCG